MWRVWLDAWNTIFLIIFSACYFDSQHNTCTSHHLHTDQNCVYNNIIASHGTFIMIDYISHYVTCILANMRTYPLCTLFDWVLIFHTRKKIDSQNNMQRPYFPQYMQFLQQASFININVQCMP